MGVIAGNGASSPRGARSLLDGLMSVSLTRIYPLFKMNFTPLPYYPLMTKLLNPLKANLTIFKNAPSLNNSLPNMLTPSYVDFVSVLPDKDKPIRYWSELLPLVVTFTKVS